MPGSLSIPPGAREVMEPKEIAFLRVLGKPPSRWAQNKKELKGIVGRRMVEQIDAGGIDLKTGRRGSWKENKASYRKRKRRQMGHDQVFVFSGASRKRFAAPSVSVTKKDGVKVTIRGRKSKKNPRGYDYIGLQWFKRGRRAGATPAMVQDVAGYIVRTLERTARRHGL